MYSNFDKLFDSALLKKYKLVSLTLNILMDRIMGSQFLMTYLKQKLNVKDLNNLIKMLETYLP